LEITEDFIAGGQWFTCPKCHKSGDMIELAAKAWAISIPATIHKLTRQGFDLPTDTQAIQAYLKSHVDYRKRLALLWTQAQPYLHHHSTELRALLSNMKLDHDLPDDRWKAGPAQVLGGLMCEEVERILRPNCSVQRAASHGTGQTRIFKGGRWRETLVLPFYVAPGRITGFGFIGRQGDMNKDYVFRSANIFLKVNPTGQEAGLSLPPDIREIAADWDKVVFAISDPLLYLDLHLRQFGLSHDTLPLVLWQEGVGQSSARTRFAWHMLSGNKLVFWDPSLSLATVQQAIYANGWISTAGPNRKNEGKVKLRDYMWRYTPTALFRQLKKTARPWHKAIAALLPDWTRPRIEDFFLQLQLTPEQLDLVRKACQPRDRTRLDKILKPHNLRGVIQIDSYCIVEQKSSWYCYRRNDWSRNMEVVCDAQLYIDEVINHKRIGQIYYKGHIRFRDQKIPFLTADRKFTTDTFGWMRKFLLDNDKGFLRYGSRWSHQALSIAASFHDPQLVHGIDTVGWNDQQLAFVLPGYRIGIDKVQSVVEPVETEVLPATNLRLGKTITQDWSQANDYAAGVFWSVLSGVLANVLAPALLRPTRGIGLVGGGARDMGLAVARKAGCLVRELAGHTTVRTISEEEQAHRWPLVVPISATARPSAVLQWVEAAYTRNCVTTLDATMAAIRKLGLGWDIITGWEPLQIDASLLDLVPKIVPAYLRDVCERRLKVQDVREDLAAFIARQGGSVPLPLVYELYYAACDDGDADAFADLLGQLVISDRLRIAEHGYQEQQDLVRTGHNLYVPHLALTQALARRYAVLPEKTRITAVLAAAGVLREVTSGGWTVDNDWWECRYRQSSGQRAGLLRVVG
jgi:hypothetical protein